jgi:very-short-patch-repair endonuclease
MTFIKGYMPWNKGMPRSSEVRLKISQKRKGQHNSPKTEFKKGYIPWSKGKQIWKDKKNPFFGRKHSKESKEKISQTRRRLFAEGKLTNPAKGKKMPDLTKLRISLAKKGRPNPKISEIRKKLFNECKLTPWNKGKHHMQRENHPLWNKPRPENVKRKISMGLIEWYKHHQRLNGMLGKHHTDEAKQKIGLKSKSLWQNPELREKFIRNILKGLLKRPTSLEKKLIELIEKYNLPFKYCGDGSVIIGGFNPDFIECNGRKLLIETANRFHHSGNYEKQRYAIFAKYGFKTLFLWWDDFFIDKYGKITHENWEEKILNRIKQFSCEP